VGEDSTHEESQMTEEGLRQRDIPGQGYT